MHVNISVLWEIKHMSRLNLMLLLCTQWGAFQSRFHSYQSLIDWNETKRLTTNRIKCIGFSFVGGCAKGWVKFRSLLTNGIFWPFQSVCKINFWCSWGSFVNNGSGVEEYSKAVMPNLWNTTYVVCGFGHGLT